jgi:hypothetical protein
MSLPSFNTQGSLFESPSVMIPGLFSEDDRYRLFAQKIWPVIARTRATLESCYCTSNGRAGVEPVLLLGVLIFQFLERVPDRQALDMLKYHLGWKLALNAEIGYKGFHPTTLVTFRQRLIEHDQANLAFRAVVEALQEEGLVPKRGKQRLDSTNIIGLVARLSALECVRETMRLALQELEPKLLEAPEFWAFLRERYVENKLDYRSPEPILGAKLAQAGEDILQLLNWLDSLSDPGSSHLHDGRQVTLLHEVFGQQFTLSQEMTKPQPVKIHAPAIVQNPHDPEAKWCTKGHGKSKKDWVGYKIQVAESIGPGERLDGEPPQNFIASMVTQSATESDEAGMVDTLAAQAGLGFKAPSELFVDGAYVSAASIVEAQAEKRELVGPAQPSPTRAKGYRTDEFDINIEERRALCPANKENTQCSRLEEEATGKVSYRFEWSTHCHDCPLRDACISQGQKHRTVTVGQHHTVLQSRRQEQKTDAFKKRMHQRNAIEGTQSELVRAHGLRRARYRGRAKVDLQNQLIGAACNIKRWLRLVSWLNAKGLR